MENADKSFCAEDIIKASGIGVISKSAVYRNLETLEREGRINRLTKDGSRKAYYRYVVADGCRDHLHITCKRCGNTFHIDERITEQIIKKINSNSDFQIDSAATMFYGICKNCNKKNKPKAEVGYE